MRCLCESTNDKTIVREALSSPAKQGNCLHVAIAEEVPDREMLDYLMEIIGDDKEVFTQTDEDGNTPLHLAVHYKRCIPPQCQLVSKLVQRSKEALGMANNEDLEPLRYHISSRESAIAEADETRLVARDLTDSRQRDEQDGGENLKKDLAPKRVNTENAKRDDNDKDEKKKPDLKRRLPSEGVGKQEHMEKMESEKESLGKEMEREAEQNKKQAIEKEAIKTEACAIEKLLKLESMRDRPRAETKKLLYGDGESKLPLVVSTGRRGLGDID